MYISKPKNPNGKGIILIHEFWGVIDQIKKTADRIAREGYIVFAADLYGGKVAKSVDEARAMKDAVVDGEALLVIRDDIVELGREGIRPENIAIWGFCMGGSFAYLAAIGGIKAGAYIIYYGSRISDSKEVLRNISAPVLGIFGGADKSIPRETVKRFGEALEDLKKTNEIDIYDDAGHAFANEDRESYNEKAAKDAWQKTIDFLNKSL